MTNVLRAGSAGRLTTVGARIGENGRCDAAAGALIADEPKSSTAEFVIEFAGGHRLRRSGAYDPTCQRKLNASSGK